MDSRPWCLHTSNGPCRDTARCAGVTQALFFLRGGVKKRRIPLLGRASPHSSRAQANAQGSAVPEETSPSWSGPGCRSRKQSTPRGRWWLYSAKSRKTELAQVQLSLGARLLASASKVSRRCHEASHRQKAYAPHVSTGCHRPWIGYHLYRVPSAVSSMANRAQPSAFLSSRHGVKAVSCPTFLVPLLRCPTPLPRWVKMRKAQSE